MIKRFNQHKLLLFFLLLYFILSGFFLSRYLISWDAGQFALGTRHFDLAMHQPHPPGYILFVSSAGLLQRIIGNINYSFIVVVWLASLAALVLLYSSARAIGGGKKSALITVILAATSPLFFYYHNVALTYVFDFLGAILALNLAIRSLQSRKNYFIASCLLAALVAGFRPSVLLVSLPILFVHWLWLKNKPGNLFFGGLIFIAGIFVWLAPLAYLSGGWRALSAIIVFQFGSVTGGAFNQEQLKYMLESLGLVLLPGAFLILFYLRANFNYWKREWKIFTLLLGLLPALLVYLFGHLGDPGYVLGLIPAFYLLAVLPVGLLGRHLFGRLLLLLIIVCQLVIFYRGPVYAFSHKKSGQVNYAHLQAHDRRIAFYLAELKNFNPEETLLLVLRGQYLTANRTVEFYAYDDIKALAYYLPAYEIYDLMGVRGLYFVHSNFRNWPGRGDTIAFGGAKTKLLILADYLHPDARPQGIELRAHNPAGSSENYYWVDLGGIGQFGFYGFQFIRQ